ncbi:hypothetical protein Slin15195_G043850 [Septoria linicola]|uniref:Uncharacterized protein n=1 Tax=Septoria linicola TaxID=215465 RepID=A0A9Q9AS93_9PEZI|nr:hypothetical protein Slin14017_G047370 [Septoria linicola]USW51066.1 hypothetical protein Slin15195_G043850 [Septoria linicola]
MAQPVLVKAYDRAPDRGPGKLNDAQALPPISSYAFADILRSVNGSRDFQLAIDDIAEICARTRLSLATEYGSHLPPLGEITVASANTPRPQVARPGVRRVLTSVPEASSGSSEGSQKSAKKRGSIFSFRKQQQWKQDSKPMRRIRISSLGKTIPAGTTTAMTIETWAEERGRSMSDTTLTAAASSRPVSGHRAASTAQASLRRLLALSRSAIAT